jgi:hypothetical protein
MAIVILNCKNCNNEYEAKSRKSMFCCFECRNETVTKSKGSYLRDYITCEICGRAVVSVSGIHMRTYHPEYSVEKYKLYFPNSPLCASIVLEKKGMGGKKGGDRMKEDEHRKRMSDSFRGENNPMHRSKVNDEFRKKISPFNPLFYKKKFPDLSMEECEKLAADKNKSIKKISPTQILYWTSRGYSEGDAKKKISELQKTFSLDICIEKYGIEEGTKRWSERQEKWKSKVFNNDTHIGGGTCRVGIDFMNMLLSEI